MTTRARNLHWIATGDAGAHETLGVMRDAVHNAVNDPTFVWWARSIVEDCPQRNETCCAYAVREFVSGAIHFQRDPVGVENITPPLVHMQKLRGRFGAYVLGDCDDAATLSAALGMAVGLPARFVALAFPMPGDPPGMRYGQDNAPYQHVFTELLAGGAWREMDTTRPDNIALASVRISRRLTYPL